MQPRRAFWLLAVAIIVASCRAAASVPPLPSASPSVADLRPSASPSQNVTFGTSASVTPSAVPSVPLVTEPPEATTQPNAHDELQPGSLMTVVADTLRVRSQPRVSDDSIMYQPLLPEGTDFLIVSGPVLASGYSWYLVEIPAGVLNGGVTRGWVAEGDRDGTPWMMSMGIDVEG